MNKEEAMQAFSGVMLGDGGLQLSSGNRNAYFYIKLSDNKTNLIQRGHIPIGDLLKFLQYFATEVLQPLDIQPCTGHPRVQPHSSKSKEGEWLPGVLLTTHCSEFLTKLYHMYYINGRRVVPEALVLSGITLAWLFMNDGYSGWDRRKGQGIAVGLCTQDLDLYSVERLESQIHNFGINTGRTRRYVKQGAGILVTVLADSSDYFMQIVDPHVIPPYRYKIKYRGSCPTELNRKIAEDESMIIKEDRQEFFRSLRARLK